MIEHTTIAEGAVLKGQAEHPVHLRPRAELHDRASLGRFGFLNVDTVVYGNTTIGRYFSAGRGVEIGVAHHPLTAVSTHGFTTSSAWFPRLESYASKQSIGHVSHPPTIIGHDVWIGAQTVVLAGVTIGDGAVVAANSVVTKDVEPYAIVGGSPAKHLKWRFDREIAAALRRSEWWMLPHSTISGLPVADPKEFLSALATLQGRPADPNVSTTLNNDEPSFGGRRQDVEISD